MPHLTTSELATHERWITQRLQNQSARRSVQLQYIPVKFHVVRRDDGTGGATMASLNQTLVLLNKLYQPVNIAFYMQGTQPDYIDNTTYFDFDDSEETLADSQDVLTAINIYVTNTLSYAGVNVAGYAYYPGSSMYSNRIFIISSQLSGVSLAHEMGHYFNLLHTFQSNRSTSVANRELVIRPGEPQNGRPFAPNCTLTGDLVCDTPADPYGISGATISNCLYTGAILDANGDLFKPMIANIMSYNSACSQNSLFTDGQYDRITTGITIRLDPRNEYTLTGLPFTVTAPTALSVGMTTAGAVVQFAYAGNDASGYLIERSLEATGNFSAVGSLPPGSFSFTDGSVAANTTYYYRVKASNATTQYSPVVSVNSGLFYCIPTYTWPISGFIPKIDNFIMTGSQTTLRSVKSGVVAGGYSDFTNTQHAVTAGQVYSFTVSSIGSSTESFAYQHVTIWLDSNQDGVLSNTEKLYQSSAVQLLGPTIISTVTIPTSASTGATRLRIRTQYAPDGLVESPCATYNFGEAEDYTLLISNAVSPACFSLTSSTTPVICPGSATGSIHLSTSGGTGPFSYSLANLTNSTGTFVNMATGSYTVTAASAGVCSQTILATVSQPAPITASLSGSVSVCGSQPVSVRVNVAGGRSPYQFQMSDGASSSTVSGYSSGAAIAYTPDQTTTYHLLTLTDADNCSAIVGLSIAMVTVNPAPLASITPSSTTLCRGQSVTLTAGTSTLYRWNTGQTTASLVATDSGTFSVTVTSQAGCSSSAVTSLLAIDCPNSLTVLAKLLLEGYTNTLTGLMHSQLLVSNLLPRQQPYSATPWSYSGLEQVTVFPANSTDWLLLALHDASGTILARKAAFVRTDGTVVDTDGAVGVVFQQVTGAVYLSVHHRNHLAFITNQSITSGQLLDFTTDASLVRGTSQLRSVGGKLAMYSGDYDANGVINNTDFNKWRLNASSVGRYLAVDGDGNGVINNQDFNRWMLNRAKVGTPGL
ncbi:GEVED domain-containing protein [uncultured Fibrella sp.]|uniref:GEVED domain-containing protein n=1 Tax=uncultured Fibrella sp. TaxID=1284596 RepID=UPI0035CA1355